jgi:N utilization substance protein A
MASVLYQSIEFLSQEKGIDPGIVVGAVEEAIALATRKFYKTQENMRGELNKETGEITAYIYKTVVADEEPIEDPLNQISLAEAKELAPGAEVGSEIRLYRDTTPLGRIAAQLAKQVIFQKVREAERDTVFNEYAHREKEVLNATVKRIEGQDVIYDLGKAEARCPKREQSRLEQFSIGERVRVVLLKVDRAAKGLESLPVGSAGDLRQHGQHPRHSARSRRAHKNCRPEPRQGRGPGGRLRGHEGHARAVHHSRAARRKDRHYRVFGRDHHFCREGLAAGQGQPRFHRGPDRQAA